MGFGAGDTNLYRYVGNSSTNTTDPSSLWLNFAIGAAIGGVSGASGELLQAGADAAWGKYGSSISIESTHNSPQSPI